MLTPPRQLKLGAFLMATGHHVAAWRHKDVPADAGLDFRHYKHLARVAEAAKFDALFVADSGNDVDWKGGPDIVEPLYWQPLPTPPKRTA